MSQPNSEQARSRVCIALGSNMGDRADHLQWAIASIESLPGTSLIACSDTFETEPVGPVAQGLFLNAAAVVVTERTPGQFLGDLQAMERLRGRERAAKAKWGPRTLDLDILLFANCQLNEPGLTVPHPHLHERLFVLEPLAQIAPDWTVPTLGRTVKQLLDDLRGESSRSALASNREKA